MPPIRTNSERIDGFQRALFQPSDPTEDGPGQIFSRRRARAVYQRRFDQQSEAIELKRVRPDNLCKEVADQLRPAFDKDPLAPPNSANRFEYGMR